MVTKIERAKGSNPCIENIPLKEYDIANDWVDCGKCGVVCKGRINALG